MKKMIVKLMMLLIAIMGCTLGGNIVSFARDENVYENAKNMRVESELLDASVWYSISENSEARSVALATALSEISNEGNGVIGVYAETTMYISVDWACLTIYLEKWNESTQNWEICEEFYQEFLPEETTPLILVRLREYEGGQPTGYYYRVRAIHELEYDDGWYEAKVTKTDGILITNTP